MSMKSVWSFWRRDLSVNVQQELPLFMRPQGGVQGVSVSPGHLTAGFAKDTCECILTAVPRA